MGLAASPQSYERSGREEPAEEPSSMVDGDGLAVEEFEDFADDFDDPTPEPPFEFPVRGCHSDSAACRVRSTWGAMPHGA
jgi:hypothetical protein